MVVKGFLIILFLIFVLTGCSSTVLVKGEGEAESLISRPAMDAGLFEAPSIAVHQGNVVYTWYDPLRRLMVASREGELCVSEGSPSQSLLSFNVLHSDGHGIYSLFRPKGAMGKGWKYMIFRASYDGGRTLTAPMIVNRDHGAMEPVIATNGSGMVYVAWYDERDGNYDIYMNISRDYGKTWLSEDMRIDTEDAPGTVQSVSPQILASGENAWVIWLDSEGKKGLKLMMRSSADAGRSWTEPHILRERENIYDPRILMVNGRIVILWCSSAQRFQYSLKGIYSDDLGKTWHPVADTKVTSWMQFEINASVDKSGNLYLVLAVRDKIKTGVDNIYFMTSSDRAQTWSEPVRLQTNTSHHTFAGIPQIASDDSGRVVTVWVDYRNIRGNIYTNFSNDYGKTWLKEEIRLSTMNRNANLPKVAAAKDGMFSVIWLEYKDDLMKDAFIKLREVTVR